MANAMERLKALMIRTQTSEPGSDSSHVSHEKSRSAEEPSIPKAQEKQPTNATKETNHENSKKHANADGSNGEGSHHHNTVEVEESDQPEEPSRGGSQEDNPQPQETTEDVSMNDHSAAINEINQEDTHPESILEANSTAKTVYQPAPVQDVPMEDPITDPSENKQTGTQPEPPIVNHTTPQASLQPALAENAATVDPQSGSCENKQPNARPLETIGSSSRPQAAPQPAIVEEESDQILHPSIAPGNLVTSLQGLQTDTNEPQQDSFQPSIDPSDVPRATPTTNDQVLNWLDNTDDTSQQLEPEEAVPSLEPRGDDEPLMSAEDQAILTQYIEDNNRDSPDLDGEEEDSMSILPHPVNRNLERVRNMDRRPSSRTGKRKRGDSFAGRRSKARSVSRGLQVEEEKEQPRGPYIELPSREEFNPTQSQRLEPKNFKWGPKPRHPVLDTTNLRNLGVRDVDPMEDDEKCDTTYRGTLGSLTVVPYQVCSAVDPATPSARPRPQKPSVQPRSGRRAMPPQRSPSPMDDDEEMESEPEQPVGMFGTPPKSIDDLPREVYGKIFRELLLSDVQIYVYESWSKVYPSSRHRNKFNIEPAILRVCKRAYWEGIRVLYGENIFVYSLRDAPGPTAKPPADVEQLAQDDSSTHVEEEDDDDGSEYQDDGVDMYADEEEQVNSRRRRRAAKDWDGDIRIAKYFSLFRHIIIEAEHNRFGVETKQSMAEAINFWKDPPLSPTQPLVPIYQPLIIQGSNGTTKSKSSKSRASKIFEPKPETPQSSNIHTLALRIFPSKKISDEGTTFITFVSFFTTDSPVVESLQTIMPQFTRLEINWKYLNPASRPTCLRLDMRHLYIRRNVAGGHRDIWRRDRLMQVARDEGVRRARSALGRLAERLQVHCDKNQAKEPRLDPDTGLVIADDWDDGDYESDEGWWPQDANGEFVEA